MGTRSLTVFKEDNGTEIVVMYRQYDGYMDGHGRELAEFLSQVTVVNGISVGEERKVANGMGCLAAQTVTHFKKDAGGFYLYPAGTRDCGEEYLYEVGTLNGEIHIRAFDRYEDEPLIFEGTPEELLKSLL